MTFHFGSQILIRFKSATNIWFISEVEGHFLFLFIGQKKLIGCRRLFSNSTYNLEPFTNKNFVAMDL